MVFLYGDPEKGASERLDPKGKVVHLEKIMGVGHRLLPPSTLP
jgi:hypothetical protein